MFSHTLQEGGNEIGCIEAVDSSAQVVANALIISDLWKRNMNGKLSGYGSFFDRQEIIHLMADYLLDGNTGMDHILNAGCQFPECVMGISICNWLNSLLRDHHRHH